MRGNKVGKINRRLKPDDGGPRSKRGGVRCLDFILLVAASNWRVLSRGDMIDQEQDMGYRLSLLSLNTVLEVSGTAEKPEKQKAYRLERTK